MELPAKEKHARLRKFSRNGLNSVHCVRERDREEKKKRKKKRLSEGYAVLCCAVLSSDERVQRRTGFYGGGGGNCSGSRFESGVLLILL